MVTEFTGYKSSTGKTFDNERDAWIDELSFQLAPFIDNEAMLRKTAEGIASQPQEIAAVLNKLTALTPPPMDIRPDHCRFRLKDEGKAFPKSECHECGVSVGAGLGDHCVILIPDVPDPVYPAPKFPVLQGWPNFTERSIDG